MSDDGSIDVDAGERRRLRWRVAAAVAALVAVAAVVFVVVRDDADDPPVEEPLALDEAALDATTAELVDLARAGGSGRYHARYEQSGGTTLELWRDGADVRQDVTSAGEEVRVVRVDGETTRCQQADGAWECRATDEGTAPDVVAQLVRDIGDVDLDASDDEIAGADVRCFSGRGGTDAGGAQLEICFTADGVLARLASDDQRLELVALDTDVPGEVFELPT